MSAVERLIYRAEDWTHGLMCSSCDHVFEEGEQFVARPHAMSDEVPLELISCVSCRDAGREPVE